MDDQKDKPVASTNETNGDSITRNKVLKKSKNKKLFSTETTNTGFFKIEDEKKTYIFKVRDLLLKNDKIFNEIENPDSEIRKLLEKINPLHHFLLIPYVHKFMGEQSSLFHLACYMCNSNYINYVLEELPKKHKKIFEKIISLGIIQVSDKANHTPLMLLLSSNNIVESSFNRIITLFQNSYDYLFNFGISDNEGKSCINYIPEIADKPSCSKLMINIYKLTDKSESNSRYKGYTTFQLFLLNPLIHPDTLTFLLENIKTLNFDVKKKRASKSVDDDRNTVSILRDCFPSDSEVYKIFEAWYIKKTQRGPKKVEKRIENENENENEKKPIKNHLAKKINQNGEIEESPSKKGKRLNNNTKMNFIFGLLKLLFDEDCIINVNMKGFEYAKFINDKPAMNEDEFSNFNKVLYEIGSMNFGDIRGIAIYNKYVNDDKCITKHGREKAAENRKFFIENVTQMFLMTSAKKDRYNLVNSFYHKLLNSRKIFLETKEEEMKPIEKNEVIEQPKIEKQTDESLYEEMGSLISTNDTEITNNVSKKSKIRHEDEEEEEEEEEDEYDEEEEEEEEEDEDMDENGNLKGFINDDEEEDDDYEEEEEEESKSSKKRKSKSHKSDSRKKNKKRHISSDEEDEDEEDEEEEEDIKNFMDDKKKKNGKKISTKN